MRQVDFYKTKKLSEFTDDEWELICMHCGKCCMLKYTDSEYIHFSDRMCRHFDLENNCCSCYDNRLSTGNCAKVSLQLLENELELLPNTCAYRLLYEGKPLPDYHPLITGNSMSPHLAGATVKSLPVYSQNDISKALYDLHVKANSEKWDDEKFEKEEHLVFKKYPIKYLLSFPLPAK